VKKQSGDIPRQNGDAEASGSSPSATPGYGKKAVEAASFVVIGFGLSQVIRLAGNIILTRLLVPELFGIVTLARVFIVGLYLFSDVGLEPAIIRSHRSNDPVFLNSAWTIQALRSAILAALACVIAFPIADFYGEPILRQVIPVIGLFSVVGGLQSTSLTKLDRELQQKKLTVMELLIQVASLVVMVITAYFFRNIWALLIGELVGSVIRVAWSHSINTASPNRFVLEKESVRELMSFGKWILLSTAMTFLASQSDRFLLGKFFSMTWFGVYSIAVNLAELPKQVLNRLSSKVLFPLLSKYVHYPRAELRAKIAAPRGKMLFILSLFLAAFGCFGDLAVNILFDQRYGAGAWILPMLAFGMWPLILIATVDISLLAIGKPKYLALGSSVKFVYMVIAIPIAFRVGGEFGAVLAVALNDIPSYVAVNYGLSKEKLSLIRQDALATLALLAATGVLLAVRVLAGLGLPGQSAFLLNG